MPQDLLNLEIFEVKIISVTSNQHTIFQSFYSRMVFWAIVMIQQQMELSAVPGRYYENPSNIQ